MKMTFLLLVAQLSVMGISMGKDLDTERLWTKDANKDGKLSKEELGDKLWKRMSAQDANGDDALDAREAEAMSKKGRRGKEAQEQPGGANLSFQVREFKATNGQALRYSLFVPTVKGEAPLPLVLCLHGLGGNTHRASRAGSC